MANASNACDFLLSLKSSDPPAYLAFLRTRCGQWGVPPTQQPVARCVEHLIHVLIVLCQGGLARPESADFKLTEQQAVAGFRGLATEAASGSTGDEKREK